MRNKVRVVLIACGTVFVLGLGLLAVMPGAAGQSTGPAYRAPRTADGKPDLNGIWEALNTANWDLLDHAARQGPAAFGALFSVPGGQGVVEGNEIPYRPDALAKKKENAEKWLTLDPEIKCYLPGVPRATYMPYPFQIVQTPQYIVMAYEFATANRIIRMNSTEESPTDMWMGWSRGRWEGDTLVIDVTNFTEQTWFDRAGDYHSDALHVIERYTRTSPDRIEYEATIEDPKVFTRPWKISMPLYRRVEKNARLVEYRCVEFAEELMYGDLTKKTSQ